MIQLNKAKQVCTQHISPRLGQVNELTKLSWASTRTQPDKQLGWTELTECMNSTRLVIGLNWRERVHRLNQNRLIKGLNRVRQIHGLNRTRLAFWFNNLKKYTDDSTDKLYLSFLVKSPNFLLDLIKNLTSEKWK